MKTIKTLKDWKPISKTLLAHQKSLGFVPTLGALHDGHLSLIERSLKENEKTVVSIFLNPTQFDQTQDLKNYPIQMKKDRNLLQKKKVDYLFCPRFSEIYPEKYRFRVYETPFSQTLCGAYRKGHFEGVLTIVLKLLNILKPKRAYFGEKDYQQYLLIRDMAKSFFIETQILNCPILREKNGLAMSSRNLRFNEKEKKEASKFFKILKKKKSKIKIKQELKKAGFRVEYIENYNKRRFGAIYFKKVRLIDNVHL